MLFLMAALATLMYVAPSISAQSDARVSIANVEVTDEQVTVNVQEENPSGTSSVHGRYRETASTSWTGLGLLPISTGTASFGIPTADLEAGTEYLVQVSLVSGYPEDARTASATFTTPEAPQPTVAVATQSSTPDTGLPTIIGTVLVEQTLTAVTTGIADEDGLNNVSYSYQWVRSDSGTDTEIAGATGSTYTLISADVGKTIKVRVFFTDDANNQETLTSAATATVLAKPNVLVILVDDLGYNDVSYNGATQIQTTNIDRLVNSGIKFTSGYVTYPTCTPSRAGLLTGRYPSRFGLEGNLTYAPFDDNHGLPIEETLFPERLQEVGYRTGIVGKWQLGAAPKFNPLNRGFDYFFGFLGGSHDYWRSDTSVPDEESLTPLIENRGVGEFDGYLTDVLTDKAIDFIKEPGETPFFLYLAYNAPHGPLQAPDELVEKYSNVDDLDRRIYLAMVDSLDQNIGRVLDALDDSALADNTIVFFLSDNGGLSGGESSTKDHADNGLLRAGKNSFHEGGIRVPFVASWPARWPKGETYTPMVISLDIAATVLELASATLEDPDRPIDGVDLDPFLRGVNDDPAHEALFWRDWRSGGYAIRSGDIKLIKDRRNIEVPIPIQDTNGIPILFNLMSDLSESQDLLAEDVRTAGELAGLWNEWNRENGVGNLFFGINAYKKDVAVYLQGHFAVRAKWAKNLAEYEIDLPVASTPNTDPPTISGTAQVGETLTASTSAIADEEGLTNPGFTYQWIRNDSGTDTDIAGETDSTYTLVFADQGKTIKVRVSFTDDAGNEETLTSDPTVAVAAAPNRDATGTPTIGGTMQVGQTLTASTSAIADEDGLEDAEFTYQWMADDADIQGATDPTYTLTEDEAGKAITVTVSFTDAEGNPESLTSETTGEVASEHGPLAGFSLVADGTGNELLALVEGAEAVTGDYNTTSFAIRANLAAGKSVGSIKLKLFDGAATEERTESYAPYSLYGDGGEQNLTGRALAAGSYRLTATAYSEIRGGGDELGTLTVAFTVVESVPTPEEPTPQEPTPPANTSATGAPTITGTAQVGETLSAHTSAMADVDGLDNVTFSYQWMADDVDIQGATDPTYTLTEDDEGKAFTVTVSFTDAEGNPETLTSDPTGEVAAKPNTQATGAPTIGGTPQVGESLTADTSEIADEDGLTNAVFSYQWLADDAKIQGATDPTYTLTSAEQGKTITVKVSFTDAEGNPETLTSDPTGEVAAKPNTQATGAPTISGTAQVGQTLTADTTGIADADGLTTVSYSYQWMADDTNIQGATDATYTLAEDDEGKAIKVLVSFTDDAGNVESRPSAPTDAVAAAPAQNSSATGVPTISGTLQVGQTLTADTSGIADEDGLTNAVFSYQWVADDEDIAGATGSSYTLTGDDEGKAITVTVSFTDAEGNPETLTSDPTGEVAAKPNTSATGVPTIDGTAQVGQTLTADTSGIDDEDGLNQVVFSYQWIRNDGNADEDIAGATGSSYTLTGDDEGKTVKVTVSFTDDAEGNPETLTSDPTAEVESQAGPLTGFTVVDAADTDQAVLWKHQTDGSKPEEGDTWKEWTDGGTLALGDPQSGRYGIRVDTESDTDIHRVALELTLESTGEQRADRTDDAAPYSLYGDEGEDALHGENLPVGSYTLKATAYTEDGEILGSLEMSFTVALAKPGKPQDLEGEASAQRIELAWKAPSGSVVVEYVVYRGTLRNGSMNGQALSKYATIDAAGKAMTYTDDNVEEGVEYRYRVAAVNSAGEGKKSNWLDIAAE